MDAHLLPKIGRQKFYYTLCFFYAVGPVIFTVTSGCCYVREIGNITENVNGMSNATAVSEENWIGNYRNLPILYVYVSLSALIFLLSLFWLAVHCFRLHSVASMHLPEENHLKVYLLFQY